MKTSIPRNLVTVFAATTLLTSFAAAQPPRERDGGARRTRDRDGGVQTREGGIPRAQIGRNESQEGTEEGMPAMRGEPNAERIQPYLVPRRDRWILGVSAYNTDTGVVVTNVAPRSPAARIGLERGDRIVSVDGYQVGWVSDRLFPLGEELQRRAGPQGVVILLIQNVRTNGLLNREVRLERSSPRGRPGRPGRPGLRGAEGEE